MVVEVVDASFGIAPNVDGMTSGGLRVQIYQIT
jgi:hypothetical protein